MVTQNLYLEKSERVNESLVKFTVWYNSDVIDDRGIDVPSFMTEMSITVTNSNISIQSGPSGKDPITMNYTGELLSPYSEFKKFELSDVTDLDLNPQIYYRIRSLVFQFRFCRYYRVPFTEMSDPTMLNSTSKYLGSDRGCILDHDYAIM